MDLDSLKPLITLDQHFVQRESDKMQNIVWFEIARPRDLSPQRM